MLEVWIYSLLSVLLVSLISLVGVFALSIREDRLQRMLLYLVSFSVGGLLGDAFLHILPEAMEMVEGQALASYILAGIVTSFVIEKFVQWRHCHVPTSRDHPHPYAFMNLVGDSVHNFIDGLMIAASFLTSFQIGIATTVAVMLHEIPQEIGDFGILMHGGFKRRKAILMNFFTALTAILGAIVSLALSSYFGSITAFILPFTIGNFVYIASSDLIPELHKETKPSKSLKQLLMILLGLGVMSALLLLE